MSGRRGLCTLLLLNARPAPALIEESFSPVLYLFWIGAPPAVLTVKARVHQRR
jgi:hypothetical protein